MAFLSKELLLSYDKSYSASYKDQKIPYEEIRDEDMESDAFKNNIHEEQLQKSFKSMANSLCIWYQNRNPKDKNPLYAWGSSSFAYYRYGSQKWLDIESIIGDEDKAEKYYLQRWKEAFPDFPIEIKRIPNKKYQYQLKFDIGLS